MKRAEENGEVGEQAVREDAVEVELQVGQLHQARAVAQESQHPAIGDQAIELVREVQVFLDHRVGGHAQGRLLWLAVQAGGFAIADDVKRRSAPVRDAMRDRVVLAVQLRAARLVFELVAKKT